MFIFFLFGQFLETVFAVELYSWEIGMYLQYNFNATRSKYKGTGADNAEKSRLWRLYKIALRRFV